MELIIEDAKGNVIYQSPINEAIVSSFVDWAKESEIDYGLVASHQATLSNRTPLISDAIDIILSEFTSRSGSAFERTNFPNVDL